MNVLLGTLSALLFIGCNSKDEPIDTTSTSYDTQTTTGSTECDFHLPEVGSTWSSDTGETSTNDTGTLDLGELSEEGLIAHWPLDGDWSDVVGGYDLTPLRSGGFSSADYAKGEDNQAYGPTHETTENGAFSADLTSIDLTAGATLEGWRYLAHNDSGGVLFGFGGGAWEDPVLSVVDQWGYVALVSGTASDRVEVEIDRLSTGCWHHIAFVIPPDFATGGQVDVYIDGDAVASTDGNYSISSTGLMGSNFTVGTFSLSAGGDNRLDEVRLWGRALNANEVAIAATPHGDGDDCTTPTEEWEPGPLCSFEDDASAHIRAMGEVRVLTDNKIMVVTDPTEWLLEEVESRCGEYLRAMEAESEHLEEWWMEYQYRYAWLSVYSHYWPEVIEAIWQPDHWLLGRCDTEAVLPSATAHWPRAVSEVWVPHQDGSGDTSHVTQARNTIVSYVDLPFSLENGEQYAVQDAWGNRLDFTYDESATVSWAIKVNQVGYLADAPAKYAYMGAWAAQTGAVDLSLFDGAPFSVVDESTGQVAFDGVVEFRADDSEISGEEIYELDFSGLVEPGDYYIRVPGAGRSWGFTLGQDALGEPFYTYARGLYLNRCVAIEEAHSPWARGDIHETYRGGFPPDSGSDYGDHSAEGWGFLDDSGAYVEYSTFEAIEATATTELLPAVNGGWHDAGDFDRRPYHFQIVEDLLVTYFMFPENFTDGQLNIPESGNGVPDIIDEARWGVDVWMAAQEESGGVGTWIEATSHPQIVDPGEDTQPYYLSLATRNSSLHYARYAAMVGRALVAAGAVNEADPYIQSAERAYAFGVDESVRVSHSWNVDGGLHSWTEPPEPDQERRLWALVELWLATGDTAYMEELESEEIGESFFQSVSQLWWRGWINRAVSVAMEGDSMPNGWGDEALRQITGFAQVFMDSYESHAYRRLWYASDHGYFTLTGWGNGLYMPTRPLIAAWHLTGDDSYREALLVGNDFHMGANPLGRVHTTGLGDHFATVALHLPSWGDDLFEVSPGVPLYGPSSGIAYSARTAVYGLVSDSRSTPDWEGLEMVLMPPPWDNDTLTMDDLSDILYETIPMWRRFSPLESLNVSQMEFTVWETTAPAAAMSGALMGPGWEASQELTGRQPRTESELNSSLWGMP